MRQILCKLHWESAMFLEMILVISVNTIWALICMVSVQLWNENMWLSGKFKATVVLIRLIFSAMLHMQVCNYVKTDLERLLHINACIRYDITWQLPVICIKLQNNFHCRRHRVLLYRGKYFEHNYGLCFHYVAFHRLLSARIVLCTVVVPILLIEYHTVFLWYILCSDICLGNIIFACNTLLQL